MQITKFWCSFVKLMEKMKKNLQFNFMLDFFCFFFVPFATFLIIYPRIRYFSVKFVFWSIISFKELWFFIQKAFWWLDVFIKFNSDCFSSISCSIHLSLSALLLSSLILKGMLNFIQKNVNYSFFLRICYWDLFWLISKNSAVEIKYVLWINIL